MAAAEVKAQQMLAEAQKDAAFEAKLSIREMLDKRHIDSSEESKEEDESEEDKGFLASFNKHPAKLAQIAKVDKQPEEVDKSLELEASLTKQVTDMAMGEAIFTKSGVRPVDAEKLQSMKKKLADKIQEKPALAQMKQKLASKLKDSTKTEQKSTGSAMKEFKELPASKPKEQDSVTMFLSKVDQQEAEEKQRIKVDEDQIQRDYEQVTKEDFYHTSDRKGEIDAANADAHYAFQTEESLDELENPISGYLAMKHPEIQQSIENADIEQMAQSHY